MNKEKKAFQFDDLINDFFAALEAGDEKQVLEDFIGDFPEFEIDFIEAAAYKRTVSEIPEYEYSAEEEEKLTLRTNSIVQNILYKYRQDDSAKQATTEAVIDVAAAAPPIVDLIEEIERKGFTTKTFAHAARLPEDVIEVFNSREVRYGSIVRQAIENVASALRVPVQIIDNYLLQSANPAPMHARADEPPQFVSQMEFLEIIKYDPDFRDEDKQYWLTQKPQEEELFGAK
jgi:hypothetical protein